VSGETGFREFSALKKSGSIEAWTAAKQPRGFVGFSALKKSGSIEARNGRWRLALHRRFSALKKSGSIEASFDFVTLPTQFYFPL